MTLLTIIAEYLERPKLFAIGGSQPFDYFGTSVGDKTSNPPIIHSNQATANISIRLNGDNNIYLRILKSCNELQIGGIRWCSNYSIMMNPPVTIKVNFPHLISTVSFDIFDSFREV